MSLQERIAGGMLVAIFGLAGSGVANAGLFGDSVHAQYLLPDIGTVAQDRPAEIVTGSTTFDFLPSASVAVTFSDTQIFVTNTKAGAYGQASFNGVNLIFLTGAPLINVVEDQIASSPSFASGSVLSFTADNIKLNLSGVCPQCTVGQQIVLDVTTAVPEPATVCVLSGGILALVGRLSRRTRRT